MQRRKTKIIVTLGRSSSSVEALCNLITAGMDVARISPRFLSSDRQIVLNNLREAIKITGRDIGVMVGLRESDIRIGCFDRDSILNLSQGSLVRITTQSVPSHTDNLLKCNNKEFPTLVKAGD